VDVVTHTTHVAHRFARVDAQAPAGQNRIQKNRDDASLAVRILARTVHVGVPQDDAVQATVRAIHAEQLLESQLADRIRTDRSRWRRFVGLRALRDLAVQSATNARKYDALYGHLGASVEEIQAADHVHLGIELRIAHADRHTGLRRLVRDHVR